jgi:hypothetical protein
MTAQIVIKQRNNIANITSNSQDSLSSNLQAILCRWHALQTRYISKQINHLTPKLGGIDR